MNRTEFITATAIILFLFFCLGWFACWLMHRLTRVSKADMGELEQMAQALHEAEEGRDEALAYLESREGALGNQLAQTEAELRAAMDGLRVARREATELRAELERARSGH
ncbi:hypothetical protein [Paenirhodobacter sp.]|uniref:hypothetical protein n=1 Tax=Paenirhodobacter sp. TaxID=1965326 RepID=UPI003B3D145B